MSPAFFALDRNAAFSAFTVDELVPSAVGALESSTNQSEGVSLTISPVSAEGAGLSGSIEPSSATAKPKLETTSTNTNENMPRTFRYMILSPLQEYIAFIFGTKLLRFFIFLQGPPLNEKTAEQIFGGLAIFQSLRIRLEDP